MRQVAVIGNFDAMLVYDCPSYLLPRRPGLGPVAEFDCEPIGDVAEGIGLIAPEVGQQLVAAHDVLAERFEIEFLWIDFYELAEWLGAGVDEIEVLRQRRGAE